VTSKEEIDSGSMELLDNTSLGNAFDRRFVFDRGVSLLGLGQTNSGKTEKSYTIDSWLIHKGHETPYVLDCAKPDELNPLAMMGLPLNIIVPAGCRVITENCPVEVSQVEAPTAEASWHLAKRGYLNVFSFRAFIMNDTDYGKYLGDFFGKLLAETMQGRRHVKEFIQTPAFIKCDEFHEVCPSNRLIENNEQRKAAAKIAKVLKKLRSSEVRICAYDQSYRDIYPAARTQFPFLLLSRQPGLDPHELWDLNYNFSRLPTPKGIMVFPEHNWCGRWTFSKFPRPDNMFVDYEGEFRFAKKKKKVVETWCKVVEDEA
jgi:hypothetical protein